jgi:site-specific recombinase XerD
MHCLRHTTGSVLANGGGERLASAKHLGYANMSNTIGYVRMSPEPLRDVWQGRR